MSAPPPISTFLFPNQRATHQIAFLGAALARRRSIQQSVQSERRAKSLSWRAGIAVVVAAAAAALETGLLALRQPPQRLAVPIAAQHVQTGARSARDYPTQLT